MCGNIGFTRKEMLVRPRHARALRPLKHLVRLIVLTAIGASLPAAFAESGQSELRASACPKVENPSRALRLHVRLLSVNVSVTPHVQPAEILGGELPEEYVDHDELPTATSAALHGAAESTVRSLDIDGDGRSDLVFGGRDGLSALVAFGLPGGRFRLGPRILFDHPMDFALARVLGGWEHACQRLLLPPVTPGEHFRLLGVHDLERGTSGIEHPARRAFAHSTITIVPDSTDPEYGFEEREIGGDRVFVRNTREAPPLIELEALRTPSVPQFVGLGSLPLTIDQAQFGLLIDVGQVRPVTTAASWNIDWDWIEHDVGSVQKAAGDFNGDGLTDLLWHSRGNRARGAWMMFALPDTPLTMPLPGVAESMKDRRILSVGDFDDSGRDSLLLGAGRSLELLRLEPRGVPAGRVQVTVDGHPTIPDEQGVMNVTIPAGETARFSIGGNGVRAQPDSFSVRSDAHISSLGIYVEVDSEADDGRVIDFGFHPQGPFVCTGFTPGYEPAFQTGESFVVKSWGRRFLCPSNTAAFESDDGAGLTCCRVPADMLLRGHDRYVERACPAGYLVTGVFVAPGDKEPYCRGCPWILRCGLVNRARYTLSEPVAGRLWGEGSKLSYGKRNIGPLDFPPGLREGFGRNDLLNWDTSGCIGPTLQSVLVAKGGGNCLDYRFATITRTAEGSAGSRPWSPLRECDRSPGTMNPIAGCPADP